MQTVRPIVPSRWLVVVLGLAALCLASRCYAGDSGESARRWYKGNTHAHSFWSDGDEFPEMVADWFKSHGYQFLVISDHNCLMVGDKWAPVERGDRAVPLSVLEKCRKRFGSEWVVLRGTGENRQVKLKTFDELAAKFNAAGKFLLIQGEEITGGVDGHDVHMNAIDLVECIMPKRGKDVAETIALNELAVREQSERLRRPILTQVNHPNFSQYDVLAEDMAQASATRFFEVYNGHPSVHNEGDATHPSTEELWDVANTIRIAKMKAPPLYAIGSDDSHNYHHFSPQSANPGRGWIMVRARALSVDAIFDAMKRGDYYASTGVVLRDVSYDAKQRVLKVVVQPEPGARYTCEFIGTLKGADPTCELIAPQPDAKVKRPGRKYSGAVGKVLASVQGDSAAYQLTGNELYVRAVVRSDKPIPSAPAGTVQLQSAWCQPVGWE